MKNIDKGQIWTICGKSGKRSPTSMLVLTISGYSGYWTVVPVHENIGLRTEMDPVIDIYSKKLDEDFEAVAVVHSVTQIPESAFSEKRFFFGSVDEETLSDVKESIHGYYKAMSKLSEIQHKEAFDPDYEEAENDLTPITSGIFELCPVESCSLDELIKFNDEYCRPLIYWQGIGICEADEKTVSEVAEKTTVYAGIVKTIKIVWNKFLEETAIHPSFQYNQRGDTEKKSPIKINVNGVELNIHVIEEKTGFRLMSIEADVEYLEAVVGNIAITLKKIAGRWIPEEEIIFRSAVTIKFIKEKNGISVEIIIEK